MTKPKTKGKDLIGDVEKAIKEMTCELTQEQKDCCARLTERELKFANLVLTIPLHGKTKPECYLEAGYNAKTGNSASVMASTLLKKTQVWEYMDSIKCGDTKTTILSLRYLDSEIKDIVDSNVVLATCKRLEDIPEHVRGSIQSVKLDKDGNITDLRMYNRVDAMKLAMQRQGALTDKKEITGANGGPIQVTNLSDAELDAKLAALSVADES